MNCRQARKYLSAFQDNELDVRTNIEVLEHVEMCADCEKRLEVHRRLKELVAAHMDSVEAPELLRARVTEAIARANQPRRLNRAFIGEAFRSHGFRIIAAAASILVVFGLIYGALLTPPAALNSRAIGAHVAVLRDQVPSWIHTNDATRAQRLALFRFAEKPSIPLLENAQFELVGVGPAELESRDVGHFFFRYKGATVSMFVFDGLPLTEISGIEKETRLGVTKIDSRGEMNLAAWRTGRFAYILVSRLPVEDLIAVVGRPSSD